MIEILINAEKRVVRPRRLEFKRGDEQELVLYFLNTAGEVTDPRPYYPTTGELAPEGLRLTFGAKLPSALNSGSFLVYQSYVTWKAGDPGFLEQTGLCLEAGKPFVCARLLISLSTTELARALGTDSEIELSSEFEFRSFSFYPRPNSPDIFDSYSVLQSTQTLPLLIEGDVIRGSEVTNSPQAPVFPTNQDVRMFIAEALSPETEKIQEARHEIGNLVYQNRQLQEIIHSDTIISTSCRNQATDARDSSLLIKKEVEVLKADTGAFKVSASSSAQSAATSASLAQQAKEATLSKAEELKTLNAATEQSLKDSANLLSEAQKAAQSAISQASEAQASATLATEQATKATAEAQTATSNASLAITAATEAGQAALSSEASRRASENAHHQSETVLVATREASEQAHSFASAAREQNLAAGYCAGEATKQAGIATTKAAEATTILASTAKVDAANVFSGPQVFNGVVSLNNGANAPTGKVTAPNLYDVTKLALTSDVILPILATDTPVDVLTFTAPSEGVYQVSACISSRQHTSDAVIGAGGVTLCASLFRIGGTVNKPIPSCFITRFKPVTSPAIPYYETYFGAADKVTNYPAYGSNMSQKPEFPYFIAFKVDFLKLKAGDAVVLRGHGFGTTDTYEARMKALSGSFLHVTKLI